MDLRLQKYSKKPKNKDELWERLEEVWNEIEQEFCLNLIECMTKRVNEVFRKRGSCTRYCFLSNKDKFIIFIKKLQKYLTTP